MTAYSAITTCALPDTAAAVLARITPQKSASVGRFQWRAPDDDHRCNRRFRYLMDEGASVKAKRDSLQEAKKLLRTNPSFGEI
jgi:hypothetical protein